MYKQLTNILNKLIQNFTYRQRFILWGILFWTTAAIPAFWVFKTQGLLIAFFDSQVEGDNYQRILGKLLNDVLQNQINSLDKSEDNILNQKALHRAMTIKLDRLEALKLKNEDVLQSSYFFGNYLLKNQLNIPSLRKQVDEISDHTEKTSDELLKLHSQLTDNIKSEIITLGFLYKLNLHADELVNNLAKQYLYILPKQQTLLADFYNLGKKVDWGKETTKKEYAEYLAKKNELRKSLDVNYEKINRYYKTYENTFPNLKESSYKANRLRINYQQVGNKLLNLLNSESKTSQELQDVFVKMLSVSGNIHEMVLDVADTLFIKRKTDFEWQKTVATLIFGIGSMIISFFAIFRVMTRHFHQLYSYLEELSHGNFSINIPVDVDEVGDIALSFHKMGKSIEHVVLELNELGKQLNEFIHKIAINTNNQKNYTIEQDESLQALETTTTELAGKSRDLALRMGIFTQESKEVLIADTSRSGLSLMQEKMSLLAKASSNILANLMVVHDKVISTGNLITFMTKVSEQAHMLSLNAAIEALSIGKHKLTFSDITIKIERFAENSAHSTNAIRKIIQDMSSSVILGKNTTDSCVKEINAGANRLIHVSNQVSSISQYGKEQTDKFQLVNAMMQKQAEATENMMDSIAQLRRNVDGNIKLVQALNDGIASLVRTSEENSQTLKQFFP